MTSFFLFFISVIVALFFLFLGGLAILIPWDAALRTSAVQYLLENSLTIVFFGIGFVVIGLALLVNIVLQSKLRYYNIKSGDHAVTVHPAIVDDYLTTYWKELFPKHDVPHKLTLKKNRFHIVVDLPALPKPQQKATLDRITHDLNEFFEEILGYHQEFYLSASFRK